MDNGAHFYKCDFQVHSPRDLNWEGERPHSEEERREFASRFIKHCREKGLDAVAITDHHDTAFFTYIKDAAQEELDENGLAVPEERRVVVFPGMELTLGIPCQALLLLDADFPVEFLPQVATALSISPNAASEHRHASIQRLDHFTDFGALHDRLNELSVLKGKYIVLPNVNSGGQFTLQRPGFLAHYKAMPCVGGYLDHHIDGLGVGDRNILEGKVEAYNFKPLGVFPTSDNRHADCSKLGQHPVWVKWAKPTAEALRQACLARKTRIAHVQPQLPSLIIESLHVSLSKFLGAIDLTFNPQFNCLIGGRGTGKSTILEYLRWGLCDQPPSLATDEDVPDFHVKRDALIANTLVPHKATVSVVFLVNGVRHTVRRRSEKDEIFLKVGDEEFRQVREHDIRELLPLQAYSQKQLSAVGVRAEELLRFVEAPIARRMSELRSRAEDYMARCRMSYGKVLQKRKLGFEIARQEVELASLEKQLASLRASLKGLSDDEQRILKDNERYATEQATYDQWQRNADKLTEVLRRTRNDLESLPSRFVGDDTLPNSSTLVACDGHMVAIVDRVRRLLEEAERQFTQENADWHSFCELRRGWQAKLEVHKKEYEAVKVKAAAQETVLKQISEIEERIKGLRDIISERREAYLSHGEPEAEYLATREQWIGLFRQRGDLLEERCNSLTQLSGGVIRATLHRGAGVDRLRDKLSGILEGTGIRGQSQKIEELCATISSSENSVHIWGEVLEELERLAGLDFEGVSNADMPHTPQLAAIGFSPQDVEKIARRLTSSTWLELALLELDDMPLFEYRQREGEYIHFADASAGQQATALLRVLLHQSGPPLVIDQPEEDLDNEVILQIVEEIWEAKANRQIIFSSHNANLVVNGDADLVVCCGYRVTGDQSGGKIKCQGAIDIDEIRKEITTVMEGGKDAFRMRKEKYGF